MYRCRWPPVLLAERLSASPPQCLLEFGSLFSPSRFFCPRLLFEFFDPGLNGCGPLRVLPPGLVQRRLRLADVLLPSVALFLPGGLFPRLFELAALLFPLVGQSGLPFCRLADRAGRQHRFARCRSAGGFCRSCVAPQIRRKISVLAERSVGADGAPENDARLLQGRRDDGRIVTFL